MSCKIDLRDQVIQEANSQGVPPEIALAVAVQESGLCHWTKSGAVMRGTSGEYGVMQLMPATAAALGVDPANVYGNIQGGVKYLRQLYDRFGDWSLAVQHYNGSGPAARAYAARVMALARGYGLGINAADQGSSSASQVVGAPPVSRNVLIGVGIVAGVSVLAWIAAS
jgi:soluble lytic murein transglycosylase-like protein